MSSLLLALALGRTPARIEPPRLVAEPGRVVHDRLGGGSRSFRIASRILGATRRVFVHLPASFPRSSPARKYPTTILFDGEFLLLPVVTTSDVLAQKGQVPESVIVAIENTDDFEGRVHDLTPPGLSVSGSSLHEGGDRFLDFLERELLPALDATFRTSAPRTLIGTSSGGILVTYAAATRDTFRFALALDGPTHLGDGWLARQLTQHASSASLPLRYVSIESRFGWSDEAWKALVASAPPSWRLYREKLSLESHTSMQFLGAYLGLRELYRDYSTLAAPVAPTTSTLAWYEKLAASYGASVVPPEPLLAQVIDDLLMEGRGAAARAAFDTLISGYGAPKDAATLRARIADVEKRPPPAETVEGLLATPFPSAQELGDYLGEWEGEQWINPAAKSRFALRLVAVDGTVAGTIVHWPEAGVELTQKLEYLKLTPEGLTFGQMNGMRPRGILMHEAHRTGDVLTGDVRFGGIRFVPPAGHEMPRHRFELRRKVR